MTGVKDRLRRKFLLSQKLGPARYHPQNFFKFCGARCRGVTERKREGKMKKRVLVIICALFACCTVRADNIITSLEYVKAETGGLLDKEQIPAKNTNTVLMHTGVSGTVGEKGIYNSSASYAAQTENLVTAGAFNTAVQNALDTEFVCIERQNGNGGCLLYKIHTTQQNLFRGPYAGGIYYNMPMLSGNYVEVASPYTPSAAYKGPVFIATVEPGAKYYMSFETNATIIWEGFYASESALRTYDTSVAISYTNIHPSQTAREITVPEGAHVMALSFSRSNTDPITWSNVRLIRQYLPDS
jgi:hypothetical protein